VEARYQNWDVDLLAPYQPVGVRHLKNEGGLLRLGLVLDHWAHLDVDLLNLAHELVLLRS
jgi:hypothetical protein